MNTLIENISYDSKSIQQHSILKSTILHLLPGILIFLFMIILAPFIEKLGYPFMITILFAIVFVAIPFELGYMLVQGRKQSGTFTLKGIVLYKNKIPNWQYLAIGLPSLFWLIFILSVFSPPIDKYLIDKVFFWLPGWLICTESNILDYSKAFILVGGGFSIILNGIIAPLVEEFYFRGFLLPRISHYGRFAPLINTVLFSLYHFFSPWQNPGRIIGLLPMIYAVSWKKNIYIGIFVHCGANFIFTVLGVLFIIFQ